MGFRFRRRPSVTSARFLAFVAVAVIVLWILAHVVLWILAHAHWSQ
jgi:hypothetical protein